MQELEATMTDLAIVRQMKCSRLDHAVDKGEVMGEKGINCLLRRRQKTTRGVWGKGLQMPGKS